MNELRAQMLDWIAERNKMLGVDLVLIADGMVLLMQAEIGRQDRKLRAIGVRAGPVLDEVMVAVTVLKEKRPNGAFFVRELLEQLAHLKQTKVRDAVKYLYESGKLRRVSYGSYEVV